MEIIIIAAIGQNNELGKDNELLWKLPNDMKFFSEITKGYPVIMGRKTYESIPKKFRPLPKRTNIVISSTQNYENEGAIMSRNFYDSLEIAESLNSEKVFIIGGSTIYNIGIKCADTMYITKVNGRFKDANVFFPEINLNHWNNFKKIKKQDIDEKHKYRFNIYELNKKI